MDMNIAEFIEMKRKESGFKSQRQLANKSGISAATISRIEGSIQKPNPETLKELAKYLNSTSYVELMVVAGYWEEEELLEPIDQDESDMETLSTTVEIIKPKDLFIKEKTPDSYKAEKEFVNKLELSDEKLLKQFNLELDGKKLTKEEAQGIIAYLRSLRSFDK